MKLLCDEMLKGLGRWLRAAGYDTDIADGEDDRALMDQARSSNRLLITRDRKLAEYRDASQRVVLLDCNGLENCAHELTARLAIDWLHRPFSRCLRCNALLQAIDPKNVSVPDDVKNDPLYRCPDCGRIYWQGGHVKRMRQKLARWAAMK